MALTIRDAYRKYGHEYLTACGLSHYFPEMKGTSHVFWVEGNLGNDAAAGKGQTPDLPLKTITKALSYCTKDVNDYIFVMNVYAPTGQTYPIQIDKSFIHIIGAWGHKSPMWIHADAQGTTYPAIEFIAGGANCELANLELGAGTSAAGIEVSGNGLWANYIHHCRFGMELGMGAEFGIELTGTGEMINWIIEDCRFGDSLTAAGIEIPTALSGSNIVPGTIIRNNIFRVADAAIGINVPHLTANFADGGIFNNKFSCLHNGVGDAITFGDTTKGVIDGNHATSKDVITQMTKTGGVPYHVGATGAASIGLNYAGGVVVTAITDYQT